MTELLGFIRKKYIRTIFYMIRMFSDNNLFLEYPYGLFSIRSGRYNARH